METYTFNVTRTVREVACMIVVADSLEEAEKCVREDDYEDIIDVDTLDTVSVEKIELIDVDRDEDE